MRYKVVVTEKVVTTYFVEATSAQAAWAQAAAGGGRFVEAVDRTNLQLTVVPEMEANGKTAVVPASTTLSAGQT